MKFVLLSFIIALMSCNLDVNTSDPQSSRSIDEAKKNGFYITEYIVSCSDSQYKVDEAWVEYAWKNEADGFKVHKKRTTSTQLNLKMKVFPLHPREYLLSWKLEDSTYGTLGFSNGCFTEFLPQNAVPEKFTINVVKTAEKRNVCTIVLTAK